MRHYISWISLGVFTAFAPMASATSVKVTATLERGHILSASDLQLAKVNMVYRIGLLEMSAYGRALGNGAVGDIITVMNLDSRQKVSGVVRKDGSVEVR